MEDDKIISRGLSSDNEKLRICDNGSRVKSYEETFRVYIAKVPCDMNEQGLINISEKLIGSTPLIAYKHQEDTSNAFETWAILEYSSKREAEQFMVSSKKYLNIDAVMGMKKSECIGSVNAEVELPEVNQGLEEIASFKFRRPEIENSNEQKLVGQYYKLAARGMSICVEGCEKYVPGPFANEIIDFERTASGWNRTGPLDGYNDYLRGYYDDYNDVLVSLQNNTLKPEKRGIFKNATYKKDMNFASQALVNEPKFDIAVQHDQGTNNVYGGFGACLMCKQVTAVCCSFCGKYFCCTECFSKYLSHATGCCNERRVAAKSTWSRNFAKLYHANSRRVNSYSPQTKDSLWTAGEANHPTRIHVSLETSAAVFKNQTLNCLVEDIILEFGEPVAFLFTPQFSEPLTRSEDYNMDTPVQEKHTMIGTIYTTVVPELEIWFDIIKVGSDLKLQSLELDDNAFAYVTLIHKAQPVCKLKIEPWTPFPTAFLKSNLPPALPPVCNSEEVTISAICSSNMLYVKGANQSLQLVKFELDLNFAGHRLEPCGFIPPAGTCVLVHSSNDDKFYRARVKKRISVGEALVHLIDRGTKDVVTVKRMYPLDEESLQVPAQCRLIKLHGVDEQPLTIKALQYLNDLMSASSSKLSLTINTSGLAILEDDKTGWKVNDQLLNCLTHSWEAATALDHFSSLPSNYAECMSVPDFEPVPQGKLIRLTVLNIKEPYLACCKTDSPLFNSVNHALVELSQRYVESLSNYCHVPRSGEKLCLAQREDNLWYRAYIICSRANSVDILFFDFFENALNVPHTKIRRIPIEFSKIPTLGTPMKLAGIWDTDDVSCDLELAYRVKQHLQPGTIIEGMVVGEEDEIILIIPQLLGSLAVEGCLSTVGLTKVQKLLSGAKFAECKEVAKSLSKLIPLEATENICDINHNATILNSESAHRILKTVMYKFTEEEVVEIAEVEFENQKKAISHHLLQCFRMEYLWCLDEWTLANKNKFHFSPDDLKLDEPTVEETEAEDFVKLEQESLLDNIFVSID